MYLTLLCTERSNSNSIAYAPEPYHHGDGAPNMVGTILGNFQMFLNNFLRTLSEEESYNLLRSESTNEATKELIETMSEILDLNYYYQG